MFDFLIRKRVIQSAQKFIDKLIPHVDIYVPEDLPLPSVKELKKLAPLVSKINGFEEKISQLSDEQLKAKTQEFKQKYQLAVQNEKQEYFRLQEEHMHSTDPQEKDALTLQIEKAKDLFRKTKQKYLSEILPEAFAVVRETSKRILYMRHFDVQMIGGIVLNGGNIAEMTTGEGKTLMATLPAYLNALTGEGVHIVTVNDYLAKRDKEWMGPIFDFLGLSVGVIQHDMDPQIRQGEYGCDITYGTNNEFGFDYLRDNMVTSKKQMVQPIHHFAIVDEVDSILIDEARTPLIISGPAEESTDKYYRANDIVKQLKGRRVTENELIDAKARDEDLSVGYDYLADEKAKSISLTDQGEEKGAQLFGIENLHDMQTIEYRHHILQAIKAKEFFKRDVDYVIRDGQVIIVDEFTGRLMPGRRWSDGLHQAVESREGIKIERENQTLATITLQNYFRMYEKLSGMTGTANTEAMEFKEIYNLECMVVPTNKKLQRKNYPDSIYKTAKEKYKAVVEEIEECYKKGQPVLVGTISIEKSEMISKMLKVKGVTHQVLNAKYHDSEAHIIAQAGRYKAVTIATNMAGRGTDIVLGGNAEYLAKNLALQKMEESEKEQDQDALVKKFMDQFRKQVSEEHEKVVALGGLYVIGTERHESRRIDNQLRGRQGRQGDPGSSRFFVSLEDDLMRLFASDRLVGMMDTLGMEEGQVLEHPWLTKAIETAQRRVESQNFEIRKHLLEFDNVMNKQREAIYDLRRSILERENVKNLIIEAIEDLVDGIVRQYLFSGNEQNSFDIDGLELYLKTTFDYDISLEKEKYGEMREDEIKDTITKNLTVLYDEKEKNIDPSHLRQMERMFLLHTIDSKWKDHLLAMDHLRSGISWRSYAQRDPVTEYKREGFEMFQLMYISINQEVAEIIFKIQPAEKPREHKSVFGSVPQKLVHNEISSLSGDAARQMPGAVPPSQEAELPRDAMTVKNTDKKTGRNEPCPCGSGKKYKKCCGR